MTVVALSLYITGAIILQVAAFAAIAFYRHWRSYRIIKSQLARLDAGSIEEIGAPAILARGVAGHVPAWEGYRDFRIARKMFEDRSRTVCSLHLTPVDGGALPDFKPGQFLTFRLNVADPRTGERKEIVRCYSLSDRPGLDHYRISVKRVPPSPELPPGLSSNYLHDAVQEGDVLSVRAPGGHFFLVPGDGPVVLIAGGIGVTPMLSMLNTSLMDGSTREIWLFYGVRDSTEHVMKEHLEMLARENPNFQLRVCYSRPLPGDLKDRDYQCNGHVDISLLRLTLSLKPYHFFVCGPRPMMEALIPALDAWGVPEPNIHYEAFGPASLSPALRRRALSTEQEVPVSKTLKVTFSRSGKSFTWDGRTESLLDFAESNGINISSGCRAGSCGSCQTGIEAGEVNYSQQPDFEIEPGCCLVCISRPVRDLTLSA